MTSSRPLRVVPADDVTPASSGRNATRGGTGAADLTLIEAAGRTGTLLSGTHAPGHPHVHTHAHGLGGAHGSAHGGAHASTLHAPGRRARARGHRLPAAGGHAALHAGLSHGALAHASPLRAAPPLVLAPEEFEVVDAARGWRWTLKRVVDVIGALVGLVLSAPLLLILAPLIKLDSPGPVVFAQMRVGRGGRLFRCYKLRTMCADAEHVLARDETLRAAYMAHGFKLPCHVDRRVTPLGRFLRTASLDELPQFWNVLCGDMSLVGPRPIVEAELAHYPGEDRRILLSVRPGLTGAWAVAGRSLIGYPQRADIELGYVRHWSISRDVAILAQTVVTVAARDGAT